MANEDNIPLLIRTTTKGNVARITIFSTIFLTIAATLIVSIISVTIRGTQAPPTKIYATYERIGNDECPPERKMIYNGVAVGYNPPLNYTGPIINGTDVPTTTTGFHCIPNDGFEYYNAAQSKYIEKNEIFYGNVAEYKTFTTSNDHSVACAVCLVEGHSLTMVLPTRFMCPEPWTKEYEGYLMTGNTCVDKELRVLTSTGGYNGGPVLRHQIALKKQNKDSDESKVLSCVVCSI